MTQKDKKIEEDEKIRTKLTNSEVRKKGLKILGKFYLVAFCLYLILLFFVYIFSPEDILFVHLLAIGFLLITVVPIVVCIVRANIIILIANALGGKSNNQYKCDDKD